MVLGMGVGFGQMFGVSLRLDAYIGCLFLVASSGLVLSFEHGGRQMLGSRSRRLLDF
jgi:hypothetical protein